MDCAFWNIEKQAYQKRLVLVVSNCINEMIFGVVIANNPPEGVEAIIVEEKVRKAGKIEAKPEYHHTIGVSHVILQIPWEALVGNNTDVNKQSTAGQVRTGAAKAVNVTLRNHCFTSIHS